MKIESISGYNLHKLDNVISPFKIVLSSCWFMSIPKYISLNHIYPALLALCNQARPHLRSSARVVDAGGDEHAAVAVDDQSPVVIAHVERLEEVAPRN
uniref:Beta-galactosidase 9 isoform X1 n=1 Tax=Rhizophora mucronata TaxID=61149 RepID=A0A2P2L5M6_RHIMU